MRRIAPGRLPSFAGFVWGWLALHLLGSMLYRLLLIIPLVGLGRMRPGWLSLAPESNAPGYLTVGEWPSLLFFSRPYIIWPDERLRHVSLTGATGSGKSSLAESLLLQDIRNGAGVCAIDPKDTLIDRILGHIPPWRAKDLILFDATDTAHPLGFNPFSGIPPHRRTLAASEILGAFRRSFASAWGPRMESLFLHAILALLEIPGATLLDIPRLLLDPSFRAWGLRHVQNPGLLDFFRGEFEQFLQKRGETLEPILNKTRLWSTVPELRLIVGQEKSSFALRQVMDEGKILLVRIPTGILGEDVSALLAALLVAKIQMAAQSRVELPRSRRRLFFLYVDEFQAYATSSFAKILAEARAFGLGLVCLTQYSEMLSKELQLSITNNVLHRIHCVHQDGQYLLQLSRLEDVALERPSRLIVPPPPLPAGQRAWAMKLRDFARQRYGRSRGQVEETIERRRHAWTTRSEAPEPSARRRRPEDLDEE